MIKIGTTTTDFETERRALPWPGKLLFGYFLFAGVAVVALWIGFLVDGTASTAAFDPVVESGISVGRVAGSTIVVAALVLPAGVGAANRAWALRVAAAGIGGLGYASLNTLGEGLAEGSHFSIMWTGALAATAVVGRLTLQARPSNWRLPPLVVVGLALPMIAIALRALGDSSGNLLRVVDVSAIPITHYLAELSMATLTLIGLLGWARGRSHGGGLALAGMGAYVYSTLNAFDWAVANDTSLIPILALTFVVAALGIVYLANDSTERR